MPKQRSHGVSLTSQRISSSHEEHSRSMSDAKDALIPSLAVPLPCHCDRRCVKRISSPVQWDVVADIVMGRPWRIKKFFDAARGELTSVDARHRRNMKPVIPRLHTQRGDDRARCKQSRPNRNPPVPKCVAATALNVLLPPAFAGSCAHSLER